MTHALNGHIGPGIHNPYQGLELRQPFPGHGQQREDFDRLLARLGREVDAEERLAMWTIYRAGRYDEWLAELRERAQEARAAMGKGQP